MLIEDPVTLERLVAALEAPGCPLCRLASERVAAYRRTVLDEYRRDPDARNDLDRSLGYCERHWDAIARQDDPLVSAVLLRSVLAEAQRRLATRFRRGTRLVPGSECPACAIEDGAAEHGASLLCGAVEESPETRELLAAGDGLCLAHLGAVVEQRDRALGRARVLTIERERLAELEAALDQLAEAQDADSIVSITPRLAGIWREALRTVVGSRQSAPERNRVP
jgi:hypothetical protein